MINISTLGWYSHLLMNHNRSIRNGFQTYDTGNCNKISSKLLTVPKD
jgi:hypothetical protein